MATQSETYSSSSARGSGGKASVRLLEIDSASSRLGSEPGDGTGVSSYWTSAECVIGIDVGLSFSLVQVKERRTNAKHAQKPRYLYLRLGLEVME